MPSSGLSISLPLAAILRRTNPNPKPKPNPSPWQPAGAGAPRRVSSPEIFALRATVTYQRVEADG